MNKMNDEIKNINYILGRQKRAEEELRRRSGWDGLAFEIVLQAVKDYKGKYTTQIEMQRIRKFFKSEWFKTLVELDPDYILRKLDEYRREHGYIVIDDNGSKCTYSGNADSTDAMGSIRAKKG